LDLDMTLTKTLLASAVALFALQAHADITFSSSSVVPAGAVTYGFELNETLPSFITLSGGAIFKDSDPGVGTITAKPPGATGQWFSVGPSSPQTPTALMSFTGGATQVSFLWGSPDTYNQLMVNGSNFAKTLLETDLNGDRSIGVYLTITATGGDKINSLSFASNTNAFEMDNFRVTAVPEPETYALMLAGLAAVSFVARRRNPRA
jgi:PEP-CTERM motif